ncbi:MAG TPA: isoprenylcysteine carboxylmethyltransferase family protein [Candidatus Acidoferrum sp.]|jgi:protein-S-isoprenylcysteine O-methyltransferase Ste14|nr:isoprenylcysteine carboxylmethyltransferase family protein [Candidatus Acidoferrum sp.]
MRPAFTGHPGASAILFLTLAIWTVIEVRQAMNRRAEATNKDRGSLMVVRLFAFAGVLLAALAVKMTATSVQYSPVMFGVSLAVVWAGVGLRWWSFQTLGPYFTFTVMTSANQPVITTGPYRFLRHPSYAGIMLILAGIGLTYGNWLSLGALIFLPLIGFIYRIRVEESALSAALGDAYTTFAGGRKRISPFVW